MDERNEQVTLLATEAASHILEELSKAIRAMSRPVIHICTGVNRRFIARTRWHGCRRYQIVSEHRSYRAAVQAMAKAFAKPSGFTVKRADVIMTADYYDAVQLCELVRQ